MEDRYYFIKRMNEKILWTYKPKNLQKVLHVFSTIFWVPLPILLVGVILCLCKLTDWKIMILFAFLSLLSYIIAFATSLSKDLEYIITNKSIIIYSGNSYCKINFEDIKTLKVVKNLFNKKYGSVKIILQDKKNLFDHLNGIENIDAEYKKISTIIIDNGNYSYNL